MRTRSLTLAVTLLCWIFASPSSKAQENPSSASASKAAPAPYDAKFMKRAIAIAQTANTIPGTDPFGAVVVKDGVIIGEGLSAMRANSDATAHGELLAIRAANKKLSTPDLSGCALYASCEPCSYASPPSPSRDSIRSFTRRRSRNPRRRFPCCRRAGGSASMSRRSSPRSTPLSTRGNCPRSRKWPLRPSK